MNRKPLQNDSIAAYQRKKTAARRVGVGARCACGESRAEALIEGSHPIICAACDRKKRGYASKDDHHPFGQANSSITIPVAVNDHRAVLNVAQADWPKETLRNPDGSPLLAAAARVRGFVDTVVHLIEKGLLWVAELLESLNTVLVEKLGPKWWVGTPLGRFTPGRSA